MEKRMIFLLNEIGQKINGTNLFKSFYGFFIRNDFAG